MKDFTYHRANSLDEAVTLLVSTPNAKLLAGGTNLLDLMKLQIETPQHLIDINHIGLDKVETLPSGGLAIGALVRNADLAAHPIVKRDYGVLTRALVSGASGQLRNRATTAGNLMQRTRCPYFYGTTKACNKRAPGSGCDAVNGFSTNLAVLGASASCIATHSSDMAVALRALDAMIVVIGPAGERRIALSDFHRLPGDTPHVETSLDSHEIIARVELPAPIGGRQIYRKVRERASYAFATVSVALIAHVDAERVAIDKLAFGGLAAKPWRVEAAEGRGFGLPGEIAEAAASVVLDGASPTDHNKYKLDLARQALHAALIDAQEQRL